MTSAREIAEALKGQREGNGFRCLCPAHDDRNPSLSITEKNGKVVFVCRAGCLQEAVLDKLIELGLWSAKTGGPNRRPTNARSLCYYDYRDEAGQVLFRVRRTPEKQFLQFRPDGNGGWIPGIDGVRRVLYRLSELIATPLDQVIYIVEGEKDAVNLNRAFGVATTCNPGGAAALKRDGAPGTPKWRSEYNQYFRGRTVVILPDNDDAGRAHAAGVARNLASVAASVHILDLPGLPPKGDVSDWLDGGGSLSDLETLVGVAPIFRQGKDAAEHRFKFTQFAHIKLETAPPYTVDGILPRVGVVLVWGPPKCGKTFWVFDIEMHVALGWQYRGRDVERGAVLHIACEGGAGLGAHKEAWRIARLAEDAEDAAIPFYLCKETALDLINDVGTVIKDIDAQYGDLAIRIITIDTLNRSLVGSESKDEDMAAYLQAAVALAGRFQCLVIIVYHCGYDETHPRGHTSLRGRRCRYLGEKGPRGPRRDGYENHA
jgi:hypothetical protein